MGAKEEASRGPHVGRAKLLSRQMLARCLAWSFPGDVFSLLISAAFFSRSEQRMHTRRCRMKSDLWRLVWTGT
jgi:hypothetical protein